MIENYHFFPIRLGSIIGFVANIFVKIIRIKGEIKAPDNSASPMKPAEGPVNE